MPEARCIQAVRQVPHQKILEEDPAEGFHSVRVSVAPVDARPYRLRSVIAASKEGYELRFYNLSRDDEEEEED